MEYKEFIEKFRDLATILSNVSYLPAREISLIIDVSGDSSIVDTYKVETWTGKGWIELIKEDEKDKLLEKMREIISYYEKDK